MFHTHSAGHLTAAEKAADVPRATSVLMEHSTPPNLLWFVLCGHSRAKFKLHDADDLPEERTEVLQVVCM